MEVLVVDQTLAKDVARCSRRAVLRSWHGYAPLEESVFLHSGHAVHSGLADYFSNWDQKRAMAEIGLEYSEPWSAQLEEAKQRAQSGEDEKEDSILRLHWDNVARVMETWFEFNTRSSLPFDVVSVEEPFALPLVDGVYLVGRIDADVVDKATRLKRTLETKTTGRVDRRWVRQFRNDAQNSLYLWANEQIKGELYTGTFVNAIELSRAPGSDRKCSKHNLPYRECGSLHPNHQIVPVHRTEEEVATTLRDTIGLANKYWDTVERWPKLEQIQEVPAEGRFTGECTYCTFQEFCAIGAKPEALESIARVERWEPFEGIQPGTWQEANKVIGGVLAQSVASS
jgi:hypothetical protein